MPIIKLYEGDTGIIYNLEVSEEDAIKVEKDVVFATQLLQRYKSAQRTQFAKSAEKTIIVEDVGSCQSQSITESACGTDGTTQEFSESCQESSDSQEKDGFRWPHEAVLLLLTLYKEHEDKFKFGKITMKKFWNMIASHLNEKDYNVTSSQCKSKMAGLKNTYKSVKDHNAKSGNNHRTWRYFDVMDEIFNKKPWMTPILTLDSSNPTASSSSECSSENKNDTDNKKDPSSYKTKMRSTRINKFSMLERMVATTEQSNNERKKMHEEAMSRQDKLLDILEKLVTTQK